MQTTGIELIDEFETWIKDHGKSENTITTYRGVLRKFYQWLIEEQGKDIRDITNIDVQKYMNFLDKEQNRSASTIDKVFATIRVLSQFLENPKIVQDINKKPKDKNIYQKTPEFLTKHEKESLLKKVKNDGDLRNIAIIYTLLYTGIRISELCNLNHSDIEIKDKQGILVIKKNQKKQQRIIPLSEEVIYPLNKYMNSLEIKKGALFVSNVNNNNRITTRAVQYMLKKYKLNPIKLRHTFCKNLVDQGVNLSVVAQLAGHSDLNMVKRYKKNSISNLKHPIEKQAFA